MEREQLTKLRSYYHSLLEQQRVLNSFDSNTIYVDTLCMQPLVDELSQLTNEFPEVVPAFSRGKFHVVSTYNDSMNLVGLRTFTAMALGRLKIAIEQPEHDPVTEPKLFSFINNTKLRAIVERDYLELLRAYIASCWKSVIILCGGTIEAILLDLLKSDEESAKATQSAPKQTDINRWDLSQLIDVVLELKLVSPSVEKMSHPIREYRNLVHPGNELRNQLIFDEEEAKIAIEVLNILHRDLSK